MLFKALQQLLSFINLLRQRHRLLSRIVTSADRNGESIATTAHNLSAGPASSGAVMTLALLTYGYLMPRAVGPFRKAAFNVFASPIHQRTSGTEMWKPHISGAEDLRKPTNGLA